MPKFVTATDMQEWITRVGEGPKLLVVYGCRLTPGAVDSARNLGVQILYPGPELQGVIRRLAQGLVDSPLRDEELAAVEARVMAVLEKGID